MKLTKSKILEILRRKNDGWTTYQIKKRAGVSIRRVNQIYAEYLKIGEAPAIGRRMGRPTRPIKQEEVELVKKAYGEYRVSASTLERLIMRDYNMHIPHNHIHKIMVKLRLAKPKEQKDIRKKDWIRYQRRHSLTAVHIDWHYHSPTEKWIFGVIDDASRMVLALIESNRATTEASIEGMIQALEYGKIKQCISDHGAQFVCMQSEKSQFKEFLAKQEIKQILCRIKHPQSNGKIEKWFDTYDRHRLAFKTKEKFLRWYNEKRPHRSLRFETLETPYQAFLRKMKAEV
jgi:putative transposase